MLSSTLRKTEEKRVHCGKNVFSIKERTRFSQEHDTFMTSRANQKPDSGILFFRLQGKKVSTTNTEIFDTL